MDSLVMVYYGQETNTVVGLRLKKVKRFLQDILKSAPGFRTEVREQKIKVEHLFTAKIWAGASERQDPGVITFWQLRDIARRNDVEADIAKLPELAAPWRVLAKALTDHGHGPKSLLCRATEDLRGKKEPARPGLAGGNSQAGRWRLIVPIGGQRAAVGGAGDHPGARRYVVGDAAHAAVTQHDVHDAGVRALGYGCVAILGPDLESALRI